MSCQRSVHTVQNHVLGTQRSLQILNILFGLHLPGRDSLLYAQGSGSTRGLTGDDGLLQEAHMAGTVSGNRFAGDHEVFQAFFLFFTVKSTFMLLPHLTEHSAVLQISRTIYYIPVGIFSAYMGFVIVVDLLNELFPGFNYFAERQKLRDAAAAAEQERENQEMLARENEFISQSGIANDEGGNAL